MPEALTKQVCRKCRKKKHVRSFRRSPSGNRRRVCHSCLHYQRSPEGLRANLERVNRKHRQERVRNPARFILIDTRSSDRKRGFGANNLDLSFIEKLVRNGCVYCGTTALRISLDRIDNSKPHNKRNVVACCFRCNYLKNSMPHEAWLHLVPAVRSAYEQGLFGVWRSKPFNRK